VAFDRSIPKCSSSPMLLHSQFKTAARQILGPSPPPPTPTSSSVSSENINCNIEFDVPEANWIREEYGGVKMWVNVTTGEVAVNAPVDACSSSKKSKLIRYPTKRHFRLEHQLTSKSFIPVSGRGMGSDYYDPSAVKELFDILDHLQK
jgi:hypothetical protein